MIRARTAGDVDVFAQFEIPAGAKDGQPPVAPAAEAVRRVPIDADVSLGAIAAQQDLAEILQFGIGWVGEVANRGGNNVGIRRAGEGEELLDLVARDIAQDATIFGALTSPVAAAD
jgi:hypothetical protein